MTTESFDTVIVGGGQAGLATGYHLKRSGRSFVILDASARIGDPWRNRWDSLRLYSPASHDGLPGLRFPAKRTSYPTAHEMADYLESYAAQFELPVRSGCAVDMLTKDDGRYVLRVGDRRLLADNVVVATGVMQKPHAPSFAPELDPRVRQLHSNDYRNLSQLQDGPVLVVGASHSGSDIAYEAASRHDTILSGVDTGQIPVRVDTRRGRMGFRLLFFAGSHLLTMDTPIGRKMRPHIRHGGAPLLRYRKKELLRRRRRADDRTNGRCPRRDARAGRRPRPRRAERRLVHRVPARPLVDRRAVLEGRRRIPRAVPRCRRLRSRALLRRSALPPLLHVDAGGRNEQGRGAGCDAHRLPTAALPAEEGASRRVARRSRPDDRAPGGSSGRGRGRLELDPRLERCRDADPTDRRRAAEGTVYPGPTLASEARPSPRRTRKRDPPIA